MPPTDPADSSLFTHQAVFPVSAAELYAWHARAGALQRLLPPWQHIEVVESSGGIEAGARVVLRLGFGPLRLPYRGLHVEAVPPHMFCDVQERGPFALWQHRHLFTDTPQGAALNDRVHYRLPGQRLLPRFIDRLARRGLVALFARRSEVLHHDLLLHSRCSARPLRFLVSGASGVLGRDLLPLLTTGGHQVHTLVRRRPRHGANEIFWDPQNGHLCDDDLPEVDAVIHLAGEYIGLSRWSEEKKRQVIDSRVQGTTLLASAMARAARKPAVFLSASAVGYYGDRGETPQSELNPPGSDFISEVCRQWEEAAGAARQAGIRTVLLRLGVGLTPRGGALQRLLAASPCGIFSRHGSGDQYISWISADDMIAAILHAATCPALEGPLNIVAPQPVSNRQLLATVAKVTGRPLLCPLPATLLRILYGQMASEILLSSCRGTADKLLASGFRFRHPSLEGALRSLLGRPDRQYQDR